MPESNAELKARLKAEADAAIEELLAKRKAPARASLADIEQAVRSASLKFEQALMAELLAESAAELPAWPTCPQCGQKMKNKGKRKRRVVTETGEVEIERHYYRCAACGQGFFPPWMNAGVCKRVCTARNAPSRWSGWPATWPLKPLAKRLSGWPGGYCR